MGMKDKATGRAVPGTTQWEEFQVGKNILRFDRREKKKDPLIPAWTVGANRSRKGRVIWSGGFRGTGC